MRFTEVVSVGSATSGSTARAPLQYEGVGKMLVHALEYKGYVCVV